MSGKEKSETYPPKEAAARFEAALRGAKVAGPQHKQSVTLKRAKAQRLRKVKKARDDG